MADALLSVEHLTTVFDLPTGPVPAADDISFEIRAGETLGLVGESGSGKSVTALSIMRLVQPPGRIARGRVHFKGRDLMREMKAAFDLSLLLITHDLGVIAETADRVAVMYAGRIVETGPVRAIFPQPQHPYTRGLLASIPGGTPGQRLRAIDGSVPRLGALPPGCAFNPRCPDRFHLCTSAPPPEYTVGAEHAARCYLHDAALGPAKAGSIAAAN